MPTSIPKIIVEIDGGDVTSIESTHAVNIAVINRDQADPSDSHYRADINGGPAQLRFYDVEPVPDLHKAYQELVDTGAEACEECVEAEDEG